MPSWPATRMSNPRLALCRSRCGVEDFANPGVSGLVLPIEAPRAGTVLRGEGAGLILVASSQLWPLANWLGFSGHPYSPVDGRMTHLRLMGYRNPASRHYFSSELDIAPATRIGRTHHPAEPRPPLQTFVRVNRLWSSQPGPDRTADYAGQVSSIAWMARLLSNGRG